MIGTDIVEQIKNLPSEKTQTPRGMRESLQERRGSAKASVRNPRAGKRSDTKKSKRGAKSSKATPAVQTFDFGLSNPSYNTTSAEDDALENYDVLPAIDGGPLDASQYQDDDNDMYGEDSPDYDARTTDANAEYATPGTDDYMELEEGADTTGADTYMQVGASEGTVTLANEESFGGFEDDDEA